MRAAVDDGLRYLLAVWYGSAWLDRVLSAEPVAGSGGSLRSPQCSLLQATQKATQNPTHSLLAGPRTVKTASPSKDQAAERLASSCGHRQKGPKLPE
jgi:hypothetical protein